MDKKKHEVIRAGVVISLAPKEYKLLDTLITNSGEAVSRQKLIDHAWGPNFKETNNELNVHIKYLRNKIEGKKSKPLIHTIRGVGFVLKEDIIKRQFNCKATGFWVNKSKDANFLLIMHEHLFIFQKL